MNLAIILGSLYIILFIKEKYGWLKNILFVGFVFFINYFLEFYRLDTIFKILCLYFSIMSIHLFFGRNKFLKNKEN
ncbi:hypothetical protein GMA11_08990 [Granulicatella sp. zg-ZJ]|uniref:hypothetical protein n=1 Tax=Granulicatella sp. zg-ZJ TaxID=2678504 RepID=UPI0013D79CBD|nr:hypothetical protein [Granulicatella sp. zg-ZJ]NEW63503.1 hypothetical protein [Granulicatella sp. zg-ZJ]